jgi:deoxyribose-phosphate aldolase
MEASSNNTITVSLQDISKMIDHSLLHPTMTDADIVAGLAICRDYNVATACVKPYLISIAKKALEGTDVLVCPVIGFPHGNSMTEVKVFEATRAVDEGGKEIDMVINIGRALGGDWQYVADEIRQINDAVVSRGAILKVIFGQCCKHTEAGYKLTLNRKRLLGRQTYHQAVSDLL